MPIKLFLLGRPGCGKSSATRHIIRHIENKKWFIKSFKDFDILKEMSEKAQYKQAFKKTLYDGFDIIDESVFDVALKELDARLFSYISNTSADEIISIEFARSDYIEAFQYFSSFVLKDAHILFINTDLNECIKRVKQRMINPKSTDDHYVSKKAIKKFYAKQILPDANMFPEKFKLVDNNGSVADFETKIDNFVKDFLK